MKPRLFLPLALATTGCVIGSEKYPRPRDLPDSTYIDRTRVLAIQAEPPEIRPGETAEVRGLIANPTGASLTVIWFACPPETTTDFGCAVDFGGLDPSTATPEDLLEAGVIGIEPGLPATYTAPPDFLDGLDGDGRREGINATLQALAFPSTGVDTDAGIDFNAVEIGFKRLVVSEAETPNHNPELGAFRVDGVAIEEGATPSLPANATVELGIEIPESAVEAYRYTTSDGATDDRIEDPYVSWYCDGGTLFESDTLYPYLDATFTTPEAPEATLTCWAVARDRRGGIAWREQTFTIH